MRTMSHTHDQALRTIRLSSLGAAVTVVALGWSVGPASGQSLLVSSFNTDSVIEYSWPSGAPVGTLVTSGSAGLDGPRILRFGPSGDLFVPSYYNHSLKQYNATTGAPVGSGTFIASSLGGLSFPFGQAWAPNGNVLLSSQNSPSSADCVAQFNGTSGAPLGNFVCLPTTPCCFAINLVFRANGNVLVSRFIGDQVLEYSYPGGVLVRTYSGGGLDGPEGVTIGPNGNLFVCSALNDKIVQFNATTGALIGDFVASGSGGLDVPIDLAFGPNGNLFVSSSLTNSILQYNGTTGAFVSAFVSAGSGGLSAPSGILFRSAAPPPPPVVSFSGAPYSALEGTTLMVTVMKPVSSATAVSVGYATSNGSAIAGGDYTAVSGTLTWAPGDTSPKTFAIPILGGGGVEPSETFFLTLSMPIGCTIGAPNPTSVTILDDPTSTDACVDALPIYGEGTFPFDNTGATTDGPDHTACVAFGEAGIAMDLWYCWTASCSAFVTVKTCGQTTVDTKIAVYAGCACPPTDDDLLACNDDFCGLQSSVTFLAETGETYLIRVGSYPGAGAGSGTFAVTCLGESFADFGDAPDDNPACEAALIVDPAHYPTKLDTLNAVPGRTGPYHRSTLDDDCVLGGAPTSESEPFQPECDWITCGNDADDSPVVLCLNPGCTAGVLKGTTLCPWPLAVNVPFGPCPPPDSAAVGLWVFSVTRGASSTEPFFANVAVDWNLSGAFGDVPAEWPLVDEPVPALPFESLVMVSGPFPVLTIGPHPPPVNWAILPFWTRFMVSEETVAPAFPAALWDGSGKLGGYDGGETEDWVVLTDPEEQCAPPSTALTSAGQVSLSLSGDGLGCQDPVTVALNSFGQPTATLRELRCNGYVDGNNVVTILDELELQGFDPSLGPVIVRERMNRLSAGMIDQVQADGQGNLVSGRVTQGVFLQIELPAQHLVLNTGVQPLRLVSPQVQAMPPLGSPLASAAQAEPIPLYVAGTSQTVGALCAGELTFTNVAAVTDCCFPDGSCSLTCVSCCEQAGGTPVIACLGDADGNGIDDACEGPSPDLDDDDDIDLADLAVLRSGFGGPGCAETPGAHPPADANLDGCVHLQDLSLLLANFGGPE